MTNGTLDLALGNAPSATSDTGTYSGGSGTVLELTAPWSFGSSAVLSVGTVEVNSAGNSPVVAFDGNSVANLAVVSGEQSGDLTVTSTLSWTGGTLGGTGTTTVASGATAYPWFASASGSVTGGHELDNAGTFDETISSSDTLDVDSGSSFLNHGTYKVTGAGPCWAT